MDAEALEKLAIANHDEFDRRWNEPNKSIKKIVEDFYTVDAIIYPPGSPPITGFKNLITFFEAVHADLKFRNSLKVVKSTGEDSYFSIFSIQVTIDDKEVDRFSTCHIWTNDNGAWKLSHDFFNSDYEKVNY
ncbi:unnamed protein product [Owenia fusiformis]|uniref:Uncharacterized protein n=1 Tax=Owenia fusiformis TaxID=6347 RepID=A0A8J1TUE8_OWEFU|nr:unnamed protein product [Owenia fusiformis]